MNTVKRPFYITLLTIVGVIQGLVALLLGIFLIVDRNDAELLEKINDSDVVDGHQITENMLLAAGIISTVIGLVVIVASIALWQGNPMARWVVAIGSLFAAASGLHSLVALHGEQQMSGAFTLVLALFTLWFLFGREETQRFIRS